MEELSSYVELLLAKFKSRGVLVDSNLLLLYLVGSTDRNLIGDGKYNKLSKYTFEDYKILLKLTGVFQSAVTTPHVLTEVSNLAGDLPEATRKKCLGRFPQAFAGVDELRVPSSKAAQRREFPFLGLTDCALAQVADYYLVVTDDARLVQKLAESGLEALNFNHLRSHVWAR